MASMRLRFTSFLSALKGGYAAATACLVPLVPAIFGGLVGCSPEDKTSQTVLQNTGPGQPSKVLLGIGPQWHEEYDPPLRGPALVDLVMVGNWLIEAGFTPEHSRKLKNIVQRGKTPVMVFYIATAKVKKGIGTKSDCDGNKQAALCTSGSNYLRKNFTQEILPVYREAAKNIAQIVQKSPIIIHMEPDWYQYSEKGQTNPLTKNESNELMNQMLKALKDYCATCQVAVDFSTWFSPDKTAWAQTTKDFFSGWDRSIVKYVGLIGKKFPFTEGKVDNFTYKEITQELSLPLIVTSAYDFGGGPLALDSSWLDETNLQKAASMNVAAVLFSQGTGGGQIDAFIKKARDNSSTP